MLSDSKYRFTCESRVDSCHVRVHCVVNSIHYWTDKSTTNTHRPINLLDSRRVTKIPPEIERAHYYNSGSNTINVPQRTMFPWTDYNKREHPGTLAVKPNWTLMVEPGWTLAVEPGWTLVVEPDWTLAMLLEPRTRQEPKGLFQKYLNH